MNGKNDDTWDDSVLVDDEDDSRPHPSAPVEPPAIDLKVFLETIGPSRDMKVKDLISPAQIEKADRFVDLPELDLYCPNERCDGMRVFRHDNALCLSVSDSGQEFVSYVCSNCSDHVKTYALWFWLPVGQTEGMVVKLGEDPAFGPRIPAKLQRLLAEHRELFLQGSKAEAAGLGIGAFAYYRRVVESAKDKIFDAIIKAAKNDQASAAMIADLEAGKREIKFSAAVDKVKHGIPPRLLIKGQNPLTLLHGALSAHLHDGSDEECILLASAVRKVLVTFAERLSEIVREDAELADAVKLLQRQRQKP